MQYYVDYERRYAIRFNGISEWIIGLLSEVGEAYRWILNNDEFVECPADTKDWQEDFDSERNLNAKLTDYSKWPKYSRFKQILIFY